VRIGNFNKDRPEPLHPHLLGHVDCAHVFRHALVHKLAVWLEAGKDVCHEVVYGALSLPPPCATPPFFCCTLPNCRHSCAAVVAAGVSDSNCPLYDVEHGRRAIGYHPTQRSEVPEAEWKTKI
jgi:hypothetical protein